jgi:translation initiation factor IF-2
VDAVKLGLHKVGIEIEELGGKTPCICISAKDKTNIEVLTMLIRETGQNLMLKSNNERNAEGVIIESQIEKGAQITGSVIVRDGVLKLDDIFVCGIHEGKVKNMIDDNNKIVQQAFPGTAVHVSGFKHVPEAGFTFNVVNNSDEANYIANFRINKLRNTIMDLHSQNQKESVKNKIGVL